MNATDQLFGIHLPTGSWLHRVPAGVKLAALAVLSLVGLVLRTWPVTCLLLAAVLLVLATIRVPVRRWLVLPMGVWVMIALLVGYQLIWGTVAEAAVVVGNLLLCLYASRALMLSTPAPELLDALVVIARPVRFVGVDPERVALAVALMVRSIPFLMGSFETVSEACRARGLQRNLFARLTPVVVSAVAYAQASGDALAARGLGEAYAPEELD